ncbi:MAG TPA: MarR family transcriptional regulator [Xanthobacteraceae bacterium]|jgi:DNA-binding MarR family transcriptional regulator
MPPRKLNPTKRTDADAGTQAILRHWREAVPNDRLAHLVKDATRGLLRALQMRLARHGVAFGHWTFLRILWEADGLTQRALSVEAGLMEPTTSAALAAMEKLGYVRRERIPGNRKNVHVYLTPVGKALRRKLVPLAVEVNAAAVRGASAADVAATRRTLLVMIENLARDESLADGARRRMPSTRELARRIAVAGATLRPRVRNGAAHRGA